MRAVWSFWSKPFQHHHKHAWQTDIHHLFAWVLSVETAKRHYPDTVLVTDQPGSHLLVDRLGLEFSSVSTELDRLNDADPAWWVLGKLWAYSLQREPFVHLDNDVFLWTRLPERLERAAVFAQNPEWFPFAGESWYRPTVFTRAIRTARGWAPEEWWWSVSRHLNEAVCCGILGGSATAFFAHYASLAIRMIQHPRNRQAWASLGSPIGDNILMEQYLLAACLSFHRHHPGSAYHGLDVDYLFASTEDAFDESRAAGAGYTHLIGGAKTNPVLLERLAARVERDYPEYYERCLKTLPPSDPAGSITAYATDIGQR